MQISIEQWQADEAAQQTQRREIARVARTIGPHVLEFCRNHVGQRFNGAELMKYVAERHGVSPESPTRILRMLRKEGLINYAVTNRAKSEYIIREVTG